MNEYMRKMDGEVFSILVRHGVAEAFIEAMKLRAEGIARRIPATPPENRPLAEGQMIFCYELADGAKSALEAAEAEAKAEAAGRNSDEDPWGVQGGQPAESLG